MASRGSIHIQDLNVDNFPVHRVSEHEFHEQILQYFRPYMRDAILIEQINWDCFVQARYHFSRYLEHPQLMSVFVEFIFGIFEDLSFVDQDIVMSLLADYSHRRLESYGFELVEIGVYLYSWQRRDSKFRNIKVPRYGKMILPCVFQKLLDKPFIFQDLDFVKRVLRFVAPLKLTSDDLSDYAKSMFKRMKKDATLCKVVDNGEPLIYYSGYPVVRLKLVLMAIDSVVCQRARHSVSQSIDSLNLFFEAIPEPLITVQDVKGILKFYIKNANTETEDTVDDFCHSFKEKFPESGQAYQPRSLAHYSRCAIRKRLHLFSTIPHGVKRLGLKKPLQNFVLLQKREFEFHPRFNPLSNERKFEIRGM